MLVNTQANNSCPWSQASYALGYNLAIEYLADYEKTWMLDSFRDLNERVLHKDINWIFLEVRQPVAHALQQPRCVVRL